jgi:integrase
MANISTKNASAANTINSFVRTANTMNKSTAYQYLSRLKIFENFVVANVNNLGVDKLLLEIKEANRDPYDILNSYAADLKNRKISAIAIKQRLITVKNFFEYNDIDISPRRFKSKVKFPRIVRKKKEALSKEDIIEILNVCDNIRLRTYIILLAATGMRATEALSIRIKDIDFNSNPAKLFVRGEENIPKLKSIESYF